MVITVLGSTNSGCGAVYEYLCGRPDVYDPLKGYEFRLLTDPGGINDLARIFDEYSPLKMAEGLRRLERLGERYRKSNSATSIGLGMDEIKGFKRLWKSYLKEIRGDSYPHRYVFDSSKHSKLKVLSLKIANRLGLRDVLFSEYDLGVDKRTFELATFSFIRSITGGSIEGSDNTVLNQCGAFWNPISSTRWLGEPKIVVVTRNPLDQYAELKLHKGFKTTQEFIRWHSHMHGMSAEHEYDDDRVLRIDFEDFVSSFETSKESIDSFLELDPGTHSSYSPDLSLPNIGKYKRLLTKQEISSIIDYCAQRGCEVKLGE